MIDIKNVSKTYNNNIKVVSDLSMIKDGEIVGLVKLL